MDRPIFQFSNVVVVENNLIGVIVKSWERLTGEEAGIYLYEVYVRDYNGVKEYRENEIRHFVYSKELTEEEEEYYA